MLNGYLITHNMTKYTLLTDLIETAYNDNSIDLLLKVMRKYEYNYYNFHKNYHDYLIKIKTDYNKIYISQRLLEGDTNEISSA